MFAQLHDPGFSLFSTQAKFPCGKLAVKARLLRGGFAKLPL